MILILIMSDGSEIRFGIGDSVQSLNRAIRDNEVDRIVVGDIVKGKVEWEKQFSAITVIPSSFGTKKQPKRP